MKLHRSYHLVYGILPPVNDAQSLLVILLDAGLLPHVWGGLALVDA